MCEAGHLSRLSTRVRCCAVPEPSPVPLPAPLPAAGLAPATTFSSHEVSPRTGSSYPAITLKNLLSTARHVHVPTWCSSLGLPGRAKPFVPPPASHISAFVLRRSFRRFPPLLPLL